MSHFQSYNSKAPNIYHRNNINSQSDKNMKLYNVLGDKKFNSIQDQQLSSSPAYLNSNKPKGRQPQNPSSNNPYTPKKVFEIQSNNQRVCLIHFVISEREFPAY